MRSQVENGSIYTVSNALSASKTTESLDNLVQVNSRAAILKRRNFFKKVAVVLTVIIVILLIALIVTIIEYVRKAKQVKYLRKNAICTSEECIRSASNLKLSMDPSVDPCDDFYKFSCGRWTEEHLNHGWYPHFSSFETADEKIAVSAINYFNSNISDEEPLPARQSRDMYLSCMDTATLNTLGYSVLVKYLKEVNLPIIPNILKEDADENFEFNWIKAETDLKRVFAMDTLIGIVVDADIYNRSNNVIYLGTPETRCPLPSPFKADRKKLRQTKRSEKEEEYTDAKSIVYKKIVKAVISAIIANETGSAVNKQLLEEAASQIWNVSNTLEALSERNVTDFENPQFYKLKVDDLQNVTDLYLAQNNEAPVPVWREYLTLLFHGVPNVTLDLDNGDYLYVAEEEVEYLMEMVFYVSKLSDSTLELYMWWIAVYSMILSTTSEIIDFIGQEVEPFNELQIYRPRSVDCANLVFSFMGLAVSYGIADKTFLNVTKPKVNQMLNDIKEAFVESVSDLKWMDAETKRLTLEKSREMISFIGYPDWLLDKESLESYYENINIHNNTFLDNMMELVKPSTIDQLNTLRSTNDRTWRSDPTTVNAYNYFADNSITVPMAILTYPFYHLGLEVLNYGAIGSILGHELTHGFDNIGRKFDKYGNYKEWWSNATSITFQDKTSCFVNQYSNYTFNFTDKTIDGHQTLGENLADNGGLHHAYVAYRSYLRRHGEEPKLAGFEHFSGLQLFFLAYGSIWCETLNVAAVKYQIEHDEHSPSAIRVLGTLQNSAEFARAFKCPAGSKMNPKRNRCRIW